jgi:sugar O-acyltransferase (sialic acid O-acetyltransferase NeuD family)
MNGGGSMNEVVLLAASGLAREVIAAEGMRARIKGILDDDPALHGTRVDGIQVLGPIGDAPRHTADFLVCIGSGSGRRDVVERLDGKAIGGDRWATFVDDAVRVPDGCEIGEGSIVLAGVVLTANVLVGRHCVLMPHATLTHDVGIRDYVTLAAGVSLGGGVEIDDDAYLGMNSSVRQHVRIGARATIGMGAVVLSDVPAGDTWVGVPAARLGAKK